MRGISKSKAGTQTSKMKNKNEKNIDRLICMEERETIISTEKFSNMWGMAPLSFE